MATKHTTAKHTNGKGHQSKHNKNDDHGTHATTDHDEIRRWAEERGAKPSCVKGTGGKRDTGMIRLDFPGYSGDGVRELV